MIGNGFRIFYADDDPDDQILFAESVAKEQLVADLVIQNDGQELLDLLNETEEPPDLIFLDVNMPRKNGIQTLQEIRQSSRFDKVPVIIFTTTDDKETIDLTRNSGASLFVTKPIHYETYKKAIHSMLEIDWKTFRPGWNDFVYNEASASQ